VIVIAGLQTYSKGSSMHATAAVKNTLKSTGDMVPMYLSDLSDADLLVRPVPGANHIAWQLGHLINSEKQMLTPMLPGAAYPELPKALVEKDTQEASHQDPPAGFLTKKEYVDLFNKVRAATIAAVEKLSDADLDKPSTVMQDFAPTLGALLILTANHDLMHAGQFTVVRRKLGKPVLF
jgi:uncharacterized damage-inducible protein DinB